MFTTIRAHLGTLLLVLARHLSPPPKAALHLFVFETPLAGASRGAALTGTHFNDPAVLRQWANVLNRRADMHEAEVADIELGEVA